MAKKVTEKKGKNLQKIAEERVLSKREVVELIREVAQEVKVAIEKMKAPTLHTPLRSLSNVRYDEKKGYFELRGEMKNRTLTSNTVKTFAQTLLMLTESKTVLETNDFVNK